MKETLLLSFGIVCILFGAVGVCAVGVAYYYTERALNELPLDIEWLFLVTNETTTDATAAVYNASVTIMTAANDLNDINILGYRPFGDTANSLRETARSVMKVGDDVSDVSGYLEDLKDILLDEISSIRLTIQITFGYIGVLHALFIMIGVGFLWIRVSFLRLRKSLQSVIDRNKT